MRSFSLAKILSPTQTFLQPVFRSRDLFPPPPPELFGSHAILTSS